MTTWRKNDDRRISDPANGARPSELVDGIDSRCERALRHEIRRRLLRTLNQYRVPWVAHELATTLPGCNISTINYHALVLEECGAITVSYLELQNGRIVRAYSTNVADDAEVTSTLEATSRQDETP
jgi:DNA-binding transcriptional ArsR family regulator